MTMIAIQKCLWRYIYPNENYVKMKYRLLRDHYKDDDVGEERTPKTHMQTPPES
jgi:hypothetical protein